MIFIFLLILLFLVPKIYAAPQVLILNYPNSVIVGDTFPITFNVFSAEIGTTYHYKIVGDTNTDLSIFPSCASRYDDCLNLVILDSVNNLATASAKINVANNLNSLKIRIAQSDKHNIVYDSAFVNILSLLPAPTSTPEIVPTIIPIPTGVDKVDTPANPLIITEIMASPDTGQNEWIEIYNPSSEPISLIDLCFYDESKKSRCISDDVFISPFSYFTHSFSSGFLNNDGDTVIFINSSVTYPKSAENKSYSFQKNGTWCFTDASQNQENNLCSATETFTSSKFKETFISPLLNLEFVPDSVVAGEDFNLVFSLKSSDLFSLRLIFPFSSSYFPFSSFKDGYSWLTLPLSVSKKLPPGEYPLSFHLKKVDSSHLYDYQMGTINIKAPIITPKVSKSKVLGVSNFSCPHCTDNSASVNYYPASTLREVKPDTNIFSWPFLFAGSILFLSPLLFPKLYSA